MVDNKYTVIKSLIDDAPHGSINWCTISFLTPKKIKDLEHFDVLGFKVHNGYNTSETAGIDSKIIKRNNPNHDIFVSHIGKIYPWDDDSSSEEFVFDNKKLNKLEHTRRENLDKMNLMKEQFKNEKSFDVTDKRSANIEKMKKRMRAKLHESGMISKQELEMLESQKINSKKKLKKEIIERIEKEMEEASTTDYLDENEPVSLKFGCITIYSPETLKGINQTYFKVRGLFETKKELNKHVNRLARTHPNDAIYSFEVGKWSVWTHRQDMSPDLILKQINYAMKCHNNLVSTEKEKFESRKDDLVKEAKMASKMRKRNKRINEPNTTISTTNTPAVSKETPVVDNKNIQEIADFLNDPELENKYTTTTGQTITVDLNQA